MERTSTAPSGARTRRWGEVRAELNLSEEDIEAFAQQVRAECARVSELEAARAEREWTADEAGEYATLMARWNDEDEAPSTVMPAEQFDALTNEDEPAPLSHEVRDRYARGALAARIVEERA